MKIRPLHDRVIVRRMEEERTSPGGMFSPHVRAPPDERRANWERKMVAKKCQKTETQRKHRL